jgi:hypothetical protein
MVLSRRERGEGSRRVVNLLYHLHRNTRTATITAMPLAAPIAVWVHAHPSPSLSLSLLRCGVLRRLRAEKE